MSVHCNYGFQCNGHHFRGEQTYVQCVYNYVGLHYYIRNYEVPCILLLALCSPPCQNGGQCDNTGTCICLPGYDGDACEQCK